ncbi:predicted protein [Nematostella vectensis]|uniref:F5/8 type C domain-containing protein n=1 Tax=Nematostella vectensis TaxID=45351 RepID=A7RWV9_NEMVE|nr:predicted protein [Nematostella vectensis]|eukprot:XP_001636158.1 predicted protein [Nematostella vectensis]
MEKPHWVKSYQLDYEHMNSTMIEYRESGVAKIFSGNFDYETVITHHLSPAIYTRTVRFLPKSWETFATMRVEMYTYGKYSPTDLGIASGELPDSQITASSYTERTPPWEGRLFFQRDLLSWCNTLSLDRQPWLEFNMSHVMLITAVAVQPRGYFLPRYVKTFQVMYYQNGQMITYKDKGKSVPRVSYTHFTLYHMHAFSTAITVGDPRCVSLHVV